jgi:hypothetical protein
MQVEAAAREELQIASVSISIPLPLFLKKNVELQPKLNNLVDVDLNCRSQPTG